MINFFDYPGATEALIITIVFGFYLGILGIPLILKKQAFTGIALSQTAAFGSVLGILISFPKFVLPFIFVLLALMIINIRSSKRTPQDGPAAILFLVTSAFGTLLISKFPTGEADLMVVQFGNILALSPTEARIGIILAISGIITFSLFYKRLLIVLNDWASAEALGYNPRFILIVYGILLTTGITYGLIVFGVMLVFGFLVAPAFISLRLSDSRSGWLFSILGLALLAGCIGLLLSFGFDFPPGPFITGLLGLSAFFVWLYRK